jgi:hypothetical protein
VATGTTPRWRALACGIALAAGAPSAAAADASLLANGDFEDGIKGWRVVDPSGQCSFEPDGKVHRVGKQSLRVEKAGNQGKGFLKQTVALPEGVKELRAVCWFKVDKGARADVNVYFVGPDGESTIGKGYVPLVGSGPNKKWEKAEERLEVPKGATSVGVNVEVTAKGTFWIDGFEITFKGAAAAPVLGLQNGGFEDGLDGWRPLEFGTGATEATADKGVHAEGRSAARLVRASPRLLPEDGLSADVVLAGGAKAQRLAFQARVEDDARASVAVQAFDEKGICVATARTAVAPEPKKFVPGSVVLEVPKGAKRLVVSLIVVGAGTVWFDDVTLAPEK